VGETASAGWAQLQHPRMSFCRSPEAADRRVHIRVFLFCELIQVSRRAAGILFVMYLCMAFVLTHLPGNNLPQMGISQWIPDADKFAHAGLYFVLAGLMANCLRFRLHSNRVIVLITMGILAIYAAFDEWSQQFSPLRSPDFFDFIADMIGASLGVSTFAIWRWLRRQARQTSLAVEQEAAVVGAEQSLVTVAQTSRKVRVSV